MAKKVLANSPYIYAWAAKEFKQKAAKIPGETVLSIIKIESGWAEIEKLPEGTYAGYPQVASRWFIAETNPCDFHEIPIPPVVPPVVPPVPGDADDAAIGAAFKLLARVLRGE